MRLILAIVPDGTVRSALERMQTDLRRARVGGNYTKAENLHLTLAFIGEYSDPERVLEVARTVPFTPFSLALDGFGCFGELYWCGLRPCPALDAYVRRLRRALAEAGIPFDRKRFSPHITLLRRARFDRLPAVDVPQAAMVADSVVLMRSDRGSDGMIYTALGASEASDSFQESETI